jgi:mannan endo-1,4-beta-mannosidase
MNLSETVSRCRRFRNLATCLAVVLLVTGLGACAGMGKGAPGKAGFVTVKGGEFWLAGKPFRFAGTNNYYMNYESDKMLTDVLDAALSMDLKVIRVWGFMNGLTSQNRDHNVYGMTAPGVYGVPENMKDTSAKDAFERLDFTVAEAGKRGLKLVIVLNNYWSDFGGVQQASTWQKWFGLEKPTDFYTNPEAKAAYKEFVRFLTTRVNSYTGTAYNRDPTIMTWELMNEPRNPDDTSGTVVTAWADEMSAYVKKMAPYQLCAVGDEGSMNRPGAVGFMEEGTYMYTGHEGTDYDALLRLPNIDYGTYHLYPEAWGILADAVQGWGVQFIEDHIEAARAVGKPAVLEEYGILANGGQNRIAVYDAWNRTVLESGGAGSMVWLLTASNDKELSDNPPGDGIYDDYDGFRIMNDGSPVSKLLTAYARRFAGIEDGSAALDTARAYLLAPAIDREVKGYYRVRAQLVAPGRKVKEARLILNGEPSNLLQYNREQDVWRFNLDTQPMSDGSMVPVRARFTLDDGTVLETEERSITIANTVRYAEEAVYDFRTDTAGVQSLGAYQATLKAIRHTPKNGGMIEVEAEFPGENEWEELKLKFVPLKEAAVAAKLAFTVYFEKARAVPNATKSRPEDNLPGAQHYLAFEPGWVKTGIKANNVLLKDLEVVTLEDGKEYYKQTVVNEFFQNPAFIGVCVCPTLGYVQYSGPVYIDDLTIYRKE